MKPVPDQKGVNVIPKLTDLLVDKLSSTLDVTPADRKKVDANCCKLADDHNQSVKHDHPIYNNTLKIYLDDTAGNTSPLLIQWDPRSIPNPKTGKPLKINYLKLEWNPAKVYQGTVKSILNLNNIIPGGFDSLLHKGRITRIDLAVDIQYIKPGNLLFFYPGIQCSQNHLKSGKIQTAYLGTKDSEKQFVIYDKKEELIKQNKKHKGHYDIPPYNMTRIELRFRPETEMGFKELLSIKNPFSSLELVASVKPTPAGKTGSDEYRLLQRVCIWEGVNQGLSFISDKSKKKTYHKQLMRQSLNGFWEPDKVWQGLPAALKNAGFHVAKLLQAAPSSG
jgi:uncharacterized protein YwbE